MNVKVPCVSLTSEQQTVRKRRLASISAVEVLRLSMPERILDVHHKLNM